jgi:hypothetical protein
VLPAGGDDVLAFPPGGACEISKDASVRIAPIAAQTHQAELGIFRALGAVRPK